MAILLDIFDKKDEDAPTAKTFENPYKEVIARYEEVEKKAELIPDNFIHKQHQ